MGDLYFWKNWQKIDRAVYLSFFSLFILSLCYYLTALLYGTDAIIDWIVVSSVKTVDVVKEAVSFGDLKLHYSIPNLLITETYEGSEIRINYAAAYLLLAFIALSIVFYLAVISTLKRFWFLVGGSLFIFMMVGLKFDQLMLFGSFNNVALYIVFGIYLPLLYYLNAFAQHLSFVARLIIFGVATLLLGYGLITFSEVQNPALYIVNYGILFPVIVSILFILTVAIEIIFVFLVVTTRGNSGQSKNSLGHFSILTLIYLVNLGLVYAKNRQLLDWDIFYINEFLLLLISAIIGIWGFRHRNSLYENIIPFRIHGGLIYLIAAVICFSTIGYLFATGNDPFVETMEDVIVFSHLSFGLFFYLYVISNFVGLLHENLEVFKIVYKPQRMPYYVMRFVGLVGFGALVFESSQLAVNQGIAGYYNGIGDLHTAVDNKQFAEQYYRLGSQFEHQNHRSNYGLANLAVINDDPIKAVQYYKKSILKKPTPYAFANLSNLYQEAGLFFDALFTLKEGLTTFPENPYLNNNIGMLYAKTQVLDSTLFHLAIAIESGKTEKVAKSNFIGALSDQTQSLKVDSLLASSAGSDYIPTTNNLLVLANIYEKSGKSLFDIRQLSDSALNPNTYAYLYNGLINGHEKDTSLVTTIEKYTAYFGNSIYNEKIAFALAVNHYTNDNIVDAFESLQVQAIQNSSLEGEYANLMGLWSLRQRAPRLAKQFFESGLAGGNSEAFFNLGIACIQIDSLEQAKLNLSQALRFATNSDSVFIHHIWPVLENQEVNLDSIDDRQKYWYLMAHKMQLSDEKIVETMALIENEAMKQAIKIELLAYFKTKNRDDLTRTLFDQLKDDRNTSSLLLEKRKEVLVDYLLNKKEWKQALQIFNDQEKEKLVPLFLSSILNEDQQSDEVAANYKYLAGKNPFKADLIIAAADYFDVVKKDEVAAYEILLKAYRVNAFSVPLTKAFILQSVNVGLKTYAEEELESLKSIVGNNEYTDFLKIYDQNVAKKEAEAWE